MRRHKANAVAYLAVNAKTSKNFYPRSPSQSSFSLLRSRPISHLTPPLTNFYAHFHVELNTAFNRRRCRRPDLADGIHPLYTVTIKLQAQADDVDGSEPRASARASAETLTGPRWLSGVRRILKDDGVAGLYVGLNAALLAVAVQSGVYYFWLDAMRTLQRIGEPAWNMLAAAQAGVVTVLMTNPLWVVNYRQMTEKACRRERCHFYGGC